MVLWQAGRHTHTHMRGCAANQRRYTAKPNQAIVAPVLLGCAGDTRLEADTACVCNLCVYACVHIGG